jgi:hypothetical protein
MEGTGTDDVSDANCASPNRAVPNRATPWATARAERQIAVTVVNSFKSIKWRMSDLQITSVTVAWKALMM